MRSKVRTILTMLAAALFLTGVAIDSSARSFANGRQSPNRETDLRGNSQRDAGGSCVYDKDGKVVFTPRGKHCPDGTDHLSNARRSDSPIIASYPAALQGELSKLLGDHDHIVKEIARLRQAIVSRDHGLALEVIDKIDAEITEHGAREARFFEAMAPHHASR